MLGIPSQKIYNCYQYDFGEWENIFRSQKDLRLINLWASVALEIWLVLYLYHQKSTCRVTGDVCFIFPAKVLLYSLLICYCLMENHFSEVKHLLTHLLMSFSSIRNMAGYVFVSPKMNLWTDWWCFLIVSSQSFIVFFFNMLLLNGKSFFRSQTDLRLI